MYSLNEVLGADFVGNLSVIVIPLITLGNLEFIFVHMSWILSYANKQPCASQFLNSLTWFVLSFSDPCDTFLCAFGSRCLLDDTTHRPYCMCREMCSDVFAPVCGDDGVTYSSECELRVSSCTQKRRIAVSRQGTCGKSCLLHATCLTWSMRVWHNVDIFEKCVHCQVVSFQSTENKQTNTNTTEKN